MLCQFCKDIINGNSFIRNIRLSQVVTPKSIESVIYVYFFAVDGETFCIQLTNGTEISLMKPAVHHTEPNDYNHNYARRVLETQL